MLGRIRWRLAALKRALRLRWAGLHRARLSGTTFVGITGTAGKTTTKDLALAVLGTAGPCQGNPGSHNWLPDIVDLVLRTTKQHRYCVLEVSADEPNALDPILATTRPSIGVVTLVQKDHLKNFKTLEAIAAEKAKLIECLPPAGRAVLNIDDPLVRRMGEHSPCEVIWFGTGPGAALRLLSAQSAWPEPLVLAIEHEGLHFEIRTRLHGVHLAVPVMAALGIAVAADVPLEQAARVLKDVAPAEGRMQIVEMHDGVIFVRDDWKAPHWSLQAPLDFMKSAMATRKVIVIGTLSDYSLSASKLYPKVARLAREVSDLVVFVGPHAIRALKARADDQDHSIVAFTGIRDASRFLQQTLQAGDLVLLKGSNRADHLVRLMLDRERPVQCWRSQCGRSNFCDHCPQAYQPGTITEPAAPPEPDGQTVPVARGVGDGRIWVAVGLGNPGEQFRDTPHNVGQRVLDRVAELAGVRWQEELEGWVGELSRPGLSVRLLKPAAMMNVCGPTVRRYVDRVGCPSDNLVVLHDDMDLLLGDVRLKHEGSDAGHKGLRSLIAALGNSGTMHRIRVGVRQKGDDRKAQAVVLGRLGEGAQAEADRGIDVAADLLLNLVEQRCKAIDAVEC